MALDLVPTTELEAVNIMLGVIGESPVSTLAVSGLANVAIARQMLHNESRNVQKRGWDYNTEHDFPLLPDTLGNINLPSNVLKADVTDTYSYKYDLVFRGQAVYDRGNRTYLFSETITFDLVLFLPFDQLPEASRNYITVRAARKFQRRVLGSETIDTITRDEEVEARILMENQDSDQADYNMMDGVDTMNILAR